MKTTIDIHDELLTRAKKYAKQIGRPLRSVVEEGIRLVLADAAVVETYQLPDCSVGDPAGADPLESMSWQEIRNEIYGNSD